MLPVPDKVDKTYQNCMSKGLKGNMITGKNLTKAQKQSNKDLFASQVVKCKVSKPKTRTPAKK